MGGCLGTSKAPLTPPNNGGGGSKSPPPVVYEESVKEVLSEIPKHRLLPIPKFHGMLHHSTPADETEIAAALPPLRRHGRPFPAEKAAGRSPARRPDTSPGRVKPGSPNGSRNMSSGRRSRSPVTGSDSGSSKTGPDAGKSPSQYPGRREFGSGDRIRKGKELERETAPTSNELLESSLVSLECFIFL